MSELNKSAMSNWFHAALLKKLYLEMEKGRDLSPEVEELKNELEAKLGIIKINKGENNEL